MQLIELTPKGAEQAKQAGVRIRKLVGDGPVDFYVSPFARTIQTARNIRLAFEPGQVARTHIG